MQVSDLFIRRPVFSVVVSLLLMVGGLSCLQQLAVREYPQVDPPIVSVNTTYKGAANEVIESRVTELIEGSVAGLEGIRQISSFSQNERSAVTIEFWVGRDPDAAAADVRDRVARIMARLPEGVDLPVVRKVDSNAAAIMWIGVTSSTLDALELTEFLKRVYVDRLATVPGVATVYVGGERRYAMRVWVDRTALAARGLTVLDVETAIKKQNVELPGGLIASSKRELTVKADSRLASPEEFEQVVVSNRNGYLVRLGEVAKVEVGPEDDRFEFYKDGNIALGLGIVRQATANTLTVADGVRAELDKLKRALPPGTETSVMYDESQFIRASINGVLKTLIEGIGLVILVILVFLRDWRSTIVAMVAIPVSVIASFMVVAVFGASINVLTLLAIVLAIGIVVDDAIVEIENIHRRIEHGEPPLLASFDGAREIGFAVIATTCTLMAVFVPLAFMTGNTGRLFREFAIHLAGADPPAHRALLRGHDQRLSLDPVAGAEHPVSDPGDRGSRLVCGGEPVPGDPEGVRADRGPRLRDHSDHRARGVEQRLHPRAHQGSRAGAAAAARARRRVEHVEPGGARLHPAAAGQCRPRHHPPRPLGPAHGEAAGHRQGPFRQSLELSGRSRLSGQPGVARPARLPAAD